MKRSAANRAIEMLALIGSLVVIATAVGLVWSISLDEFGLPANAGWVPWAITALGAIVAAMAIINALDNWKRP